MIIPTALFDINMFYGLLIVPGEGQSVLDCLKENVPLNRELKITTPCGREIVYPTLEDIPTETVHCPCGNPNHWIVKIERNYDE